jgi:ABC-2 type transport system ATP-binding protein
LGNREARARIGFLPEHFRFHEWLNAAEFLDLHGRLYGMSRNQRSAVIPDLLELVGLGQRANTKLSAFSKGMLQRIGLAQAMINDPELIFLDEPTSGLDPLGRRLVRDIITGLRSERTTVFLNSHLLSEIELTCDRVAFIREGQILQVSSIRELESENLQITLRVGQPSPELLIGLSDFGRDITFEQATGRISLNIENEEQIPILINWLVLENHSIYELSPKRLSLEDRFLQIVGDQMYDA